MEADLFIVDLLCFPLVPVHPRRARKAYFECGCASRVKLGWKGGAAGAMESERMAVLSLLTRAPSSVLDPSREYWTVLVYLRVKTSGYSGGRIEYARIASERVLLFGRKNRQRKIMEGW
jgi:hypothetical protein